MKVLLRTIAFGLAVTVAPSLATAKEGWVKYEAKEYGFSMLIPEGTKFAEKSYTGGWNELFAEHDGVRLYALAKLGEKASPEDIEKVGVNLTGIPDSAWKTINKGENQGGWIWYRTVEAEKNGKLVIGDYGAATKGSYLILLETTESDYQENKDDYQTWYHSIQFH
jgi:hypothetical protein